MTGNHRFTNRFVECLQAFEVEGVRRGAEEDTEDWIDHKGAEGTEIWNFWVRLRTRAMSR